MSSRFKEPSAGFSSLKLLESMHLYTLPSLGYSSTSSSPVSNPSLHSLSSALDPEAIKVKNWRHKLQRAFLGKDGTLKAEVSSDIPLLKIKDNQPDSNLDPSIAFAHFPLLSCFSRFDRTWKLTMLFSRQSKVTQ